MLMIIAEGLTGEYEKYKSRISPKEFAKNNIKLGKHKYDNSTKFYDLYFGDDIESLVNSIREYQRIHGKSHTKDEHCLAELLKA